MGDWRALDAVASHQFGVFSTEQAQAAGISSDALRKAATAGRLVRMHRGVYRFAVAALTWHQQAFAATLLLGPCSALSHQTAGVLHGLDGVRRAGWPEIHLTATRGDHVIDVPGLIVHRSGRELRATVREGLRVTALPRTLIDLAGVLDERNLERALDAGLRQNPQLTSNLRWLLADLHGVPGLPTLRALLEARGNVHTDTILEADVLRALRLDGFPLPQTQVDVFDEHGFISRVDFAWLFPRVALLPDGFDTHSRHHQFHLDHQQRARLTAAGWRWVTVSSRTLPDQHWRRALRVLLGLPGEQRRFFGT